MVLQRPAQNPAKKLSVPVPPVPDILLEMLLVAQHLNTAAAVGTRLPLTNRPVELTHNLFVPPGANTTVLVSVVVPRKLPSMMFESPVVTQQPAKQPRNMLFEAVVFSRPAHRPANKLLLPVVFSRPASSPMKVLKQPVVLAVPDSRPMNVLQLPKVF